MPEIYQFNELETCQLYDILRLREKVFVVEQNCVYADLDDNDQESWHVCLYDGGTLAAYARYYILDEKKGIVKIGRVVTDPDYRRKGLGSKVVSAAIRSALGEISPKKFYIEAQCYAIPFYENLGFKVKSEPFLEDGIPHVKMERRVSSPSSKKMHCPECDSAKIKEYSDGLCVCQDCGARWM